MKRILAFLAGIAVTVSAMADEGMWLLPLLKQLNGKDMKAAGCKLSPEEIYSINKTSLKDAIVHFGGGCTGEMISAQGLLPITTAVTAASRPSPQTSITT